MPLKKATKKAVETGGQINANKIPDSDSFAEGGLNDGTVQGVVSAPPTYEESTKMQQDTVKIEHKVAVNTAKQTQAGVNTFGLVAPRRSEDNTLEGQDSIADFVAAKVWACVVENQWYGFFTQETLQVCVDTATRHDYKIFMEKFGYKDLNTATDLCVLSLVDIYLVADNSHSMNEADDVPMGRDGRPTDDKMTRLNLLKLLIQQYGFTTTLFDTDGIVVELLNPDPDLPKLFPGGRCREELMSANGQLPTLTQGNYGVGGVSTQQQVEQIFSAIRTRGLTPTGETIERIFARDIQAKLSTQTLAKPILVWIITDGFPNGKDPLDVMRNIKSAFLTSRYGGHGMMFGFSQVGEDEGATRELARMDADKGSGPHPGVGDIVDCTSSYEIELKEVMDKNPGMTRENTWYTPQLHSLKVMLGPVLTEYDALDEMMAPKAPESVFGGMMGKVRGIF